MVSERWELREEDEMIVDTQTCECWEVKELDPRAVETVNDMDSLIKGLIKKCVENNIDIHDEIMAWGSEYDDEAGLNLNDWNE